MSDLSTSGSPYTVDNGEPVDDWSEQIYAELKDWPVGRAGGEWTRWEPGYLLLTISEADGEEIEPVHLCTADGRLTVTFGFWETDAHDLYGPDESDPVSDVEHATALVEDWLAGRVKTAVFFKADSQWCASISIPSGEEELRVRETAQGLQDFQPTTVEVQTPRRHEWRTLTIRPEWLASPDLSPDRLPE